MIGCRGGIFTAAAAAATTTATASSLLSVVLLTLLTMTMPTSLLLAQPQRELVRLHLVLGLQQAGPLFREPQGGLGDGQVAERGAVR